MSSYHIVNINPCFRHLLNLQNHFILIKYLLLFPFALYNPFLDSHSVFKQSLQSVAQITVLKVGPRLFVLVLLVVVVVIDAFVLCQIHILLLFVLALLPALFQWRLVVVVGLFVPVLLQLLVALV